MTIGGKEGFPCENKDKLSVGAHLFTNKDTYKKTLRNTDKQYVRKKLTQQKKRKSVI